MGAGERQVFIIQNRALYHQFNTIQISPLSFNTIQRTLSTDHNNTKHSIIKAFELMIECSVFKFWANPENNVFFAVSNAIHPPVLVGES